MKKYLLKRLLRLIPVFLGVTILAFLLTGLSSVDAVDLKESSSGGVMSEAEKEACGAGACHDGLSFVSARYLKCKISEYMGGPQYQPVLLCR